MHARNFDILKEDYQITLKKLPNLIFFFARRPFLWTRLWKTKGAYNQLPTSLWVAKHVSKISSLVIYQLGNLDDLIQSGFSFIPKIKFANLCKPIHDVIIIPVSSDSLNLEAVERKETVPLLGFSSYHRAKWLKCNVV